MNLKRFQQKSQSTTSIIMKTNIIFQLIIFIMAISQNCYANDEVELNEKRVIMLNLNKEVDIFREQIDMLNNKSLDKEFKRLYFMSIAQRLKALLLQTDDFNAAKRYMQDLKFESDLQIQRRLDQFNIQIRVAISLVLDPFGDVSQGLITGKKEEFHDLSESLEIMKSSINPE